MGERFNELPTPHLSFIALVITLMMYSAFTKVDCQTLVQHMKISVISLNIVQINILHQVQIVLSHILVNLIIELLPNMTYVTHKVS
jgi:hypothetical protein